MTNQATTAKQIRKELKANFKGIKFSVTAPYYGKVCISFENGVKTENVTDIVQKYKSGHYDGMNDIYEFSNKNEDVAQVEYISINRDFSEDMEALALKHLMNEYGSEESIKENARYDYMGTIIRRVLVLIDFTNDAEAQIIDVITNRKFFV